MQIKELHSDIARYLQYDCYCPNEIYSGDGFFYQIFKPEDACQKIADCEKFVAAVAKDQTLIFWKEEGKIVDATRYDATSNNMDIVVEVAMTGKPSNRAMDKFEKNTTQEDLQKILDLADAIMISKR